MNPLALFSIWNQLHIPSEWYSASGVYAGVHYDVSFSSLFVYLFNFSERKNKTLSFIVFAQGIKLGCCLPTANPSRQMCGATSSVAKLSLMWSQTFLRGNLWIHKERFPRTLEHKVPHLLLKKYTYHPVPWNTTVLSEI